MKQDFLRAHYDNLQAWTGFMRCVAGATLGLVLVLALLAVFLL